MISPYKLSGCWIDGPKEKLGLPVDGSPAVDLGDHRLWRNKMGHGSVGGGGFLIVDIEIQKTFPEELACGCIIGTEREC
jgi:hypothetical protein